MTTSVTVPTGTGIVDYTVDGDTYAVASGVISVPDAKVIRVLQAIPGSTAAGFSASQVPVQTYAGAELAATPLQTTLTASLTTSFADIAAFAVAPLVNVKPLYIDFFPALGATTLVTVLIQLFDVTANAAVGQMSFTCPAGATAQNVAARWRVAPASGARAYKLRWACGSGTTTGALYGADTAYSTGLYVVER